MTLRNENAKRRFNSKIFITDRNSLAIFICLCYDSAKEKGVAATALLQDSGSWSGTWMRQYSREEYSHRDIISKTFVLDMKNYVRNESLFLFLDVAKSQKGYTRSLSGTERFLVYITERRKTYETI